MMKNTKIFNNIDISSLLKAVETFEKGLAQAETELERDGVIQRFEFTYELAWKFLKRILSFKGLEVNNPRDVFREAAHLKLIDDPLIWFEFLRKRNLTVHTYNAETANEIFESMPAFKIEVDKLVNTIKKL